MGLYTASHNAREAAFGEGGEMRKPKFRAGQVVAIWDDPPSCVPTFYRIKGFYFDEDNELRYTFDSRNGDSVASSLRPIESLLRPLTRREIGASGGKRK